MPSRIVFPHFAPFPAGGTSDPVRSVPMVRRVPTVMILAISSLCAALGLFESANGVLMLTPVLVVALPLLAGFNPAGPAVEKLIGILRLERPRVGDRLPAVFSSATFPLHGRTAAFSLRTRGPPPAVCR